MPFGERHDRCAVGAVIGLRGLWRNQQHRNTQRREYGDGERRLHPHQADAASRGPYGPLGAARQRHLVAASVGSHTCTSTPGRMTSALPAMSDGCHLDRRILRRMRVLVVEDHATLAGRIAQGLRQAGMAVDAVHDGAAAMEAAARTAYDVIVL